MIRLLLPIALMVFTGEASGAELPAVTVTTDESGVESYSISIQILLVMTLLVSAVTGSIAWEVVNPITMIQRGLVFGLGLAWATCRPR